MIILFNAMKTIKINILPTPSNNTFALAVLNISLTLKPSSRPSQNFKTRQSVYANLTSLIKSLSPTISIG